MITPIQENSGGEGSRADGSGGARPRAENRAFIGDRPRFVSRESFADPGSGGRKGNEVAPRNYPRGERIDIGFEQIKAAVAGEVTVVNSDWILRARPMIRTVEAPIGCRDIHFSNAIEVSRSNAIPESREFIKSEPRSAFRELSRGILKNAKRAP